MHPFRPHLLPHLLLVAAAACSPLLAAGGPRSDGTVRITVRNPSASAVSVSVCAPASCSPVRVISPGRESRFTLSSNGGTRAVVTAKRGDRVVDQQPVDVAGGGEFQVVLNLP